MLKQIWTDDSYVYVATTSGLDVIDLETEQYYDGAVYSGSINTVWASEDYVYVGTADDGIKYLSKTCISGGYNLETCLMDYSVEPDLTNNEVNYIHGYAHPTGDFLVACTISGVDTFGPSIYYHRHRYLMPGAIKCFMTSNLEFYYTTTGTISKINRPFYDWIVADKIFTQVSSGSEIIDIFITVGTSVSGAANTIFIATSNGVYIIDEESEEVDIYYTAGG